MNPTHTVHIFLLLVKRKKICIKSASVYTKASRQITELLLSNIDTCMYLLHKNVSMLKKCHSYLCDSIYFFTLSCMFLLLEESITSMLPASKLHDTSTGTPWFSPPLILSDSACFRWLMAPAHARNTPKIWIIGRVFSWLREYSCLSCNMQGSGPNTRKRMHGELYIRHLKRRR